MTGTSVETIKAREIRRGDRVWAPNDGDWLLVDRFEQMSHYGEVVVYRIDHSEASFDLDGNVLRQVPASSQERSDG